MQAESQPDYPLLYSLQGFRYCDLLLAEAERAAWQVIWEPAVSNRRETATLTERRYRPSPSARRRRSSG